MSCSPPIWLEYIKTFSTIIIAIIAAIITGIFAYRQWRTAQAKLLADLFDRRFQVYGELAEVVADWELNGSANLKFDNISKFAVARQKAKFLFGDEVHEFLEITNDRLIRLRSVNRKLSRPNATNYEQVSAEDDRLIESMSGFYRQFDELVLPFMQLDQKLSQSKKSWLARLRPSGHKPPS